MHMETWVYTNIHSKNSDQSFRTHNPSNRRAYSNRKSDNMYSVLFKEGFAGATNDMATAINNPAPTQTYFHCVRQVIPVSSATFLNKSQVPIPNQSTRPLQVYWNFQHP